MLRTFRSIGPCVDYWHLNGDCSIYGDGCSPTTVHWISSALHVSNADPNVSCYLTKKDDFMTLIRSHSKKWHICPICKLRPHHRDGVEHRIPYVAVGGQKLSARVILHRRKCEGIFLRALRAGEIKVDTRLGTAVWIGRL
jgi:hypothetical protein